MKLTLALVVVISTWGMLMLAATSMEITKPKSPPPPPPAAFPTPQTAPGLVLLGGSGDAASYSKFIGDLRNKVKDPKRSYFGVPMIRLYPRLQYMYVELQSSLGNSITLAIRMSDLYVDGYSYKYKGQEVRARFLKLDSSIQAQVQANLFPDAKNKDKDIGYDGLYIKLENEAKKNRADIPLGGQTLETYINEIIYKDPTKVAEFRKTEARLLLVVIQMVSEAVRFKYIENKIKDNFSAGYYPDPRALDLENNWEKLTEAIVAADKAGKIPKKLLDNLKIKNADGTQQNIQSVYDITPDMGLLKYIAASTSLLATI